MGNASSANALFRGKNKNGEWVYGSLIRIYDKVNSEKVYAIISEESEYAIIDQPYVKFCTERIKINPETIGQYIGVKDITRKNKIFRGDIVANNRGDIHVIEHRIHSDVSRGHGDCSSTTTIGYSLSDYGNFDNNFSECRVVGNIWDNPEYLESGSKNMFRPKEDVSKKITPKEWVDEVKRILVFGANK